MTLQNYYQYRHVDKPGWKLGWTWANNEVIWSMSGAIATDRGNCSSYSGSQMPHSCKKDPTIVDLSLDVSQNRSEHCCRGGLLSAWSIDPFNAFSSFELEVRNVGDNNPLGQAPNNLTLMAPGPGYTCSPLLDTDLSVSSDFGGLRQVPVLSKLHFLCHVNSIQFPSNRIIKKGFYFHVVMHNKCKRFFTVNQLKVIITKLNNLSMRIYDFNLNDSI